MDDYFTNWSFCSDDFITSYKIAEVRKAGDLSNGYRLKNQEEKNGTSLQILSIPNIER